MQHVPQSEEEWKEQLTEQEYQVLRKGKTEPAGSGELLHNQEDGTYCCAGCGQPLFSSDVKYNSGTGWPSFYTPLDGRFVTEVADSSHGMERTEVRCARCDSHLGHVFADGPQPTGLRYCINAAALTFEESS